MTKRITLKNGPAEGKTYLVPDDTRSLVLPSGERYDIAQKTGKLTKIGDSGDLKTNIRGTDPDVVPGGGASPSLQV